MKSPKFNFVPESQLTRESASVLYRVTITKNSMLRFTREVLEIYELANKYVKMFADTEKKVIGWKVITGDTLSDLKGLRHLKPVENQGGSVHLSIKSMLKKVKPDIQLPMKGIEVKKYESSYLEGEIFYIELNNNEEENN